MKIAFHLAHPAQFHLFKNIMAGLRRDHQLVVTYNEKDVLAHLIANSPFADIAVNLRADRKGKHLYHLVCQFLKKEFNLYRVLEKERPDLILGTSVIIAHVGKLLKIPSIIVNEDDFDVIAGSARIGYPFCSHILAPLGCRVGKWGAKVIRYRGYHELAYLGENYFTPREDIKQKLRLKPGEPGRYFILRFSGLAAHHDIGKKGISRDAADRVIRLLAPHGRIFITAEGELAPEFEQYRIAIDPLDIHHALYYADMFIGDSQTMTAEAAVLGTPAVRCNSFVGRLSYLEELEHKYGLTYGIPPDQPQNLLTRIEELLAMPDLKETWQRRRKKMLADKIDVTAFMVWLIENYPHSAKDKNYQASFKC